jgi:hypothetical protein
MTLTTIIVLNVVLDLALLALLAFVMTRPAKLTPHRPGVSGSVWRRRRPHRRVARPAREERSTATGTLSHSLD